MPVTEAAGELYVSLLWTLACVLIVLIVLIVHVGAVVRHALFGRPEHDVLRHML